jgi:hypothetical protein
MTQRKSPGTVYVGRMLFATKGLVDDLIDRVRVVEEGAHRAARTLLEGGDCPHEGSVQASPHTVVELRAAIADLSSRIDALAGHAALGDGVRSAT